MTYNIFKLFKFIKPIEHIQHLDFVPAWIKKEHECRYQFASSFVLGKTVVDCACGDGTGSMEFIKNNPKIFLGIDVSEEALKRIGCLNKNEKNVLFLRANALQLPIIDATIDLFISLETIEHIREDQNFLTNVINKLNNEGTFICSTPNCLVTNPGININEQPWNKFHIREYSVDQFRQLLSLYFDNVVILGQNPVYKYKARSMRWFSKILKNSICVRINQAIKIPYLFFDNIKRHQVMNISNKYEYEYLIAVCKQPRRVD